MKKDTYIKLTEGQLEEICKTKCSKCETKSESFSIIGASRELGISESTIHRMIKNDLISKTIINKAPRIMKSEVDRIKNT